METVTRVSGKDLSHALGRATRNSRLFNYNLARGCDLGDTTGRGLDVTSALKYQEIPEIGSKSSSDSVLLGRSVYRDKYNICLDNSSIYLAGEEEILSTTAKYNIVKTRLVDGELVAIPSIDAGLVDVNDGDLYVWAFMSDDRTGWSTNITSA